MTATNVAPNTNVPTDLIPATIKLSDLGDNPKNARRTMDPAKIKALADTMTTEDGRHNLQNRPVVYLNPDKKGPKYLVAQGSRRRAAAVLLKWDTIDVSIAPEATPAKRLAVNGLVENLQRESLTEFEQAMEYRRIAVEYNMSGADLSKQTGVSSSHINNLMYIPQHLSPQVIKQWEAGHRLATFDTVRKLASIKDKTGADDHAAQDAAWGQICAGQGAPTTDAGGAPGGDGNAQGRAQSGTGVRAVGKNLTLCLDALKRKDAPEKMGAEKAAFGVALLNFIVGQRQTPPEGIEAAPKKAKKGKKSKKAKAGNAAPTT